MNRVGVIGIGHGRFGRRDDASVQELAFEAFRAALDDSGLTPAMPNSPFIPEKRPNERLMCLRSPQLKRNSLMTVGEKLCIQLVVVFQWRLERVPARGSANSFENTAGITCGASAQTKRVLRRSLSVATWSTLPV